MATKGTPAPAEIRKHYFLDHYVVIAPGRAKRPQLLPEFDLDEHAKSDSCVFCVGHEAENSSIFELPNPEGDWLVRVIKNKYPALSPDNPKAYGDQEIIIETRAHLEQLPEMSVEHIVKVFEVYKKRIAYLQAQPHIKYVIVFKNEGGKAGASVPHAHSQIWALPLIPPDILHEAQMADEYMFRTGSCVWCDVAKKEAKSPRHVFEDSHIVAFTPYAALMPYELWIMPKKHHLRLDTLNGLELHSLAKALKQSLHHLEKHGIAYDYFIHQSLDPGSQHLHIVVKPRPNIWGGLELGSGLIVNPVSPEEAAHFYRSRV